MKIKAIVIGLLVLGGVLFAAPNIHGQSKVLKNAPIAAKAVVDGNVKLLETNEEYDVFRITLSVGSEIEYFCVKDEDATDVLIGAIQNFGVPDYVIPVNKDLDKHVAKVTKLYGNSVGMLGDGTILLNTYDEINKTFQFYRWNNK